MNDNMNDNMNDDMNDDIDRLIAMQRKVIEALPSDLSRLILDLLATMIAKRRAKTHGCFDTHWAEALQELGCPHPVAEPDPDIWRLDDLGIDWGAA